MVEEVPILTCRVCGERLDDGTKSHEDGQCARCSVKFSDVAERESVWRSREAKLTALSGVALLGGLALWLLKLDPVLVSVGGRPITPTVLLYLVAAGLGAWSFLGGGLRKLFLLLRLKLRLTELGIDSLMSLAILGAIAIGEYVEAASLAFLFSLAELLEQYAVDRARHSLRELMKLAVSGESAVDQAPITRRPGPDHRRVRPRGEGAGRPRLRRDDQPGGVSRD